nr:hypothetical protein [Pedobacter puniceum]
MKANHNGNEMHKNKAQVVVNISSSKNESKSQHGKYTDVSNGCCCKYQ